MNIDFFRFTNAAICQTWGSSDAAGYNIYSVVNVSVPPTMVKLIRIDIGFKIPRGYFGKILARSSFALRFTDAFGGVIDADYRGPMIVMFFNFSSTFTEIEKGMRFTQIIFQIIAPPTLREIEKFTDTTQKDTGSFGSTGFRYV